jgi:hypothetical protein
MKIKTVIAYASPFLATAVVVVKGWVRRRTGGPS